MATKPSTGYKLKHEISDLSGLRKPAHSVFESRPKQPHVYALEKPEPVARATISLPIIQRMHPVQYRTVFSSSAGGSKCPIFKDSGPKSHFGTRVLKCWVLGPSGIGNAQRRVSTNSGKFPGFLIVV